MPGEDTPTQHKSLETATDADVQRMINQLSKFPLTSEHDDAPDALEGAVQLAWSSAQAGARLLIETKVDFYILSVCQIGKVSAIYCHQ